MRIQPDLSTLVDPARMRAVVEKLAGYPTRNTSSPFLSEAAEWLASEYRKLPQTDVEVMPYQVEQSQRIPEAKEVVQVVARRKGTFDRQILIGGHFDTINMSADPITGRAPGANDDASGVAVALEVARAMGSVDHKLGLVFCAFSGEEQGLLGSGALAKRAKTEGWKLDAVFSNDMVGSSGNLNGQKDERHVRVFSDDVTDKNPTPNSRELARFIEWITRDRVKDFGIKLVIRKDRFGRGGDHSPFHDQGFSAVRFVEVHEEYTHQHTPDDLPEHMDWQYLANSARINLLAYASLSQAAEPPSNVRIIRDQSHDTTINWKSSPGTCYTVLWRETTSATWQDCLHAGETDKATIKKVNKDDYFFAVGAEGGIPVEAR